MNQSVTYQRTPRNSLAQFWKSRTRLFWDSMAKYRMPDGRYVFVGRTYRKPKEQNS